MKGEKKQMRNFYQEAKSKVKGFIVRNGARIATAGAIVVGSASSAMASVTMPTLPTSDLETAGTAVLGLVAVAVVIGIVVRTFKKA
jgi:hypothetical protein